MLGIGYRQQQQQQDEQERFDDMPEFGDHVDSDVFGQILEMDENEDEREFSAPLVFGFFDQAFATFEQMEKALSARELAQLSSLGHFLKGSSATLGFNKIRDSCQIIQQYGNRMNVDGTPEPDEAVCLEKVAEALAAAQADTAELKKAMTQFFGQSE